MEEVKKDVDNEMEEVKKNVDNEINESYLFMTEDNVFDIIVQYNEDGGKIIVEKVDDKFILNEKTKKISITIKYPSQGDSSQIIQMLRTKFNTDNEVSTSDIIQLEFIRLLVLARKWSLSKPLNNENIMKLHPKIVKAIILSMRDNIALDGIF